MSIHASSLVPVGLTGLPGLTLAGDKTTQASLAVPTVSSLNFFDAGELIYAYLPPTEGWQPFRYAAWFAEQNIPLSPILQEALAAGLDFDATKRVSYLIAAIPTSPHEEQRRTFASFEIMGIRRNLKEMPLEAVFWMYRCLTLSGGAFSGHAWAVGMHKPLEVDGAKYRLSFTSVADADSPKRQQVMSTCVVSPNGRLSQNGVICFLSGAPD
jgi:hypothetical protein